MTNSDTVSLEEKLKAAVQMPQPRPEFLSSLRTQLAAETTRPISLSKRLFSFLHRPAWSAGLITMLLAISFFAVGSQQVFAAVRELLGYIPGTGIVEQNTNMRILAEPVTVTKEGVSITVKGAVLAGDKTHISYDIEGVPQSAYPTDKNAAKGCVKSDYLRLPDGKKLEHLTNVYKPIPTNIDFEPIPADVNDAVFVIPCIYNTLPGTVAENWEIPLHFTRGDVTILPVSEISPIPQALTTEGPTSDTKIVDPSTKNSVIVQKAIKTEDGYILLGLKRSPTGVLAEAAGRFEIRDASGKTVDYTYPQDISLHPIGEQLDDLPWAAQFKAEGLQYPLTIRFPMIVVQHADPNARAELEINVGNAPEIGQELASGQEIQLLGHTLKLVSLKVDAFNAYTFSFQGDEGVNNVNVGIEGYSPIAFGGGRNENGTFDRMLRYNEIPTGKLKVNISDMVLSSNTVTWEGQWSPDEQPK